MGNGHYSSLTCYSRAVSGRRAINENKPENIPTPLQPGHDFLLAWRTNPTGEVPLPLPALPIVN